MAKRAPGNKKDKTTTAPAVGHMVGIDPHKLSLSAAVVDERGGVVAVEHFKVSGAGHRAMEAWALSFGPVARWGVEGASGLGRHTATYLVGQRVRSVSRPRYLANSYICHRRSLSAAGEPQSRSRGAVSLHRGLGEPPSSQGG